MIFRALLLSASLSTLSAYELVVRDFRIALGTGGTDFDYSIQGSTVDANGNDTFDSALSLDFGGRWSFARPGDALGLVIGADLGWESMGFGSGSLQTLRGRGSAGLGWSLNDFWTLTSELGLLYGRSTWEVPSSVGAESYTADGDALGYDLRIDATWRLSKRLGVGAFIGWQIMEHEVESKGVTSTLDRSDWVSGILVFWRFSNAPPTLQ